MLLLALAMSVDAFSVALGVGCGNTTTIWSGLRLSAAFGVFQFIMPVAGAMLGNAIGRHFSGMSYVAAAILFLIALKMLRDTRKPGVECVTDDPTLCFRLVILAVATSIDAFGVGIPVSLMRADTLIIASVIGIVCFFVTFAGFFAGRAAARFFKNAEYLGAAVLFGIGVKMLIT